MSLFKSKILDLKLFISSKKGDDSMSTWDHNEENYLKLLNNPLAFREEQRRQELFDPWIAREQKRLARINNLFAVIEEEKRNNKIKKSKI